MDNKKLVNLTLAISLACISSATFASAFQSFEQSESGLGDAYAGAASAGDDAATEWYNPAAMVMLPHAQASTGAVLVRARTEFIPTAATDATGAAMTDLRREYPLGTSVLPNFHVVAPLSDRWFLGFGISVPFGLETDYSQTGTVRYMATKSKLAVIDFGLHLAYKITNKLSFALGPDLQYAQAELNEKFDTSSALMGAGDTDIQNVASDWAVGGVAALLYQFTPNTRFGLVYRSPVKHHLSGDLKVKYPTLLPGQLPTLQGLGVKDGRVTSSIVLPETITGSIFHAFNPHISVAGSVAYTHWSRFKKLTLHFDTGLADSGVYEDFHDSFRYALGVVYHWNNRLLFRFGGAIDQSPTNDAHRTIRLPDANRWWLTFGTQYHVTPHFAVDLGYGFVKIAKGTVNQVTLDPTDANNSSIKGRFRHSYAHLVGLQLSWTFFSEPQQDHRVVRYAK